VSKRAEHPANKDAATSSYYSIARGSESVTSLGTANVPSVVREEPLIYGVEEAPGGYVIDSGHALKISIKDRAQISANDVADYFLSKNDETAGELISNLKLQKLLYYAQGFHLAITDKPLFPERIEAWIHGPVVPRVYHRFKDYGETALPAAGQRLSFDKETAELLEEVHQVYGQFSAWKLREMTHEEAPWKSTPPGATIPHSLLQSYFKTLLA
jgi:uncharacterized phage-associated protein